MLRTFDEQGGIGVYSRNLVRELLRIDRSNQYVLLYRRPEHIGSYAQRGNVTERWVRGRNKAIWDQIAVPYACWRERVDVLLHPKFTVPLLAPCKAVMVVHGADWFVPEQARFYRRWDVRYIKTVMPWYFRKASVVISVSQLTTDHFRRVFDLPQGRIKTVYFGPAKHFRRVEDPAEMQAVRARYGLPDRFILTLSKHGGGDRKNIGNILTAYQVYRSKAVDPHKLVVGGKDCDQFRADYTLPDDGYGSDVLFPGWIDQADLPAVYSAADLYLYPSRLEAFPIPVTEAMACGTPVITSNVTGLREIAGDAALMVDPEDVAGIADAISRLLADAELRASLSAKGLARARRFSWEECASKVLRTLESVVG
jgi:glycosyltransferase involved in cell wall biosynthesis